MQLSPRYDFRRHPRPPHHCVFSLRLSCQLILRKVSPNFAFQNVPEFNCYSISSVFHIVFANTVILCFTLYHSSFCVLPSTDVIVQRFTLWLILPLFSDIVSISFIYRISSQLTIPHNLDILLCSVRANKEAGGGAWCPHELVFNEGDEYLEVNLAKDHLITKVEVQGRFGNGQGREFAQQYKLQYYRFSIDKWVIYSDGHGSEVSQ